MRYKSKPVVIDAVQYTEDTVAEVAEFCYNAEEETHRFNSGTFPSGKTWAEVYDYLQDTWVGVNEGDYIIKGTKGEFYPCDPEVFAAKYEPDYRVGGLLEPEFTKGAQS